MQTYLTGPVIRRLREARGLTQAQLAAQLFGSDKTVSKWETAKGRPDISLVEPLAVFAVALGAFCGGFCSAKIVREKGLLLGICCGAVPFCVLAFFGVGGEGFGTAGLIRLAVIPLCGGVGGILGVDTRSRRK